MATFEQYSVWLVPFPFTDQQGSKRRPVVVVSSDSNFNTPAGHSVMAMITTSCHAPWPLDVTISDLASAGLPSASVIRLKMFTLDHRLAVRKIGMLSKKNQKTLEQNLMQMLGV
jgi:mRNA interferase MazF